MVFSGKRITRDYEITASQSNYAERRGKKSRL
jgi:hypothetical protein